MSDSPHCVRCAGTDIRWTTIRSVVGDHETVVPVDVLRCARCEQIAAEDDWIVPGPLGGDRCVNCGERRIAEACSRCGLNASEDQQVHFELLGLIWPDAPTDPVPWLDAARRASKHGRRLLAAKLATAGAVFGDEASAETCRALRVWLLAAIGEGRLALADSRAWVAAGGERPSVLALASLGQQLELDGHPGSACEAYQRAATLAPDHAPIRAQRARLLFDMGRLGQASQEVVEIFKLPLSNHDVAKALPPAERLAERFVEHHQAEELSRLFSAVGEHAGRSARLLAVRARIAYGLGDKEAARRDLKLARQLDPNLEVFKRLDQPVG